MRAPATAAPATIVPLRVTLTNTGDRAGKKVVQVYAEGPTRRRPPRPLARRIRRGDRGARGGVTVEIAVPARAFADWADGGWELRTGAFTLQAGTSVSDVPLSGSVSVT